jgi:hypothetical protein
MHTKISTHKKIVSRVLPHFHYTNGNTTVCYRTRNPNERGGNPDTDLSILGLHQSEQPQSDPATIRHPDKDRSRPGRKRSFNSTRLPHLLQVHHLMRPQKDYSFFRLSIARWTPFACSIKAPNLLPADLLEVSAASALPRASFAGPGPSALSPATS